MHDSSTIEFLGCEIHHSENTLTPRVETEFLPEHAAPYLESCKTVWDICTGTGCLGLSVKKAYPHLDVTLSDICPKAAAVAQKNAVHNNLDVKILIGDLFEPFEGQKADAIFFNPPYVTESEYADLDLPDPKIALVSGPTGFEFYERFALEMTPYLNKNAKLFFEIGTGQGPKIKEIFGGGRIINDLAGHERYFILEIDV